MSTALRDAEWVRNAFMIPLKGDNAPQGGYEDAGGETRIATTAAYKFTNSSLGGNWAINNPPQFTRYADIRHHGIGRPPDDWASGMGRYYSEAIDDTRQVIHMTFGVPRYNSVATFFTTFYDSRMALLANTGRSSGLFYNIGLVGGFVVTLPLQPFILGITAIKRVWHFMQNNSPSKWYHMKPTMHSYWAAVNTIANELAINQGLIPRVYSNDDQDLRPPSETEFDESLIKTFYEKMPDIFRKDGGIDIMAMANRSQRMANHAREATDKIRNESESVEELHSRLNKFVNGAIKDPKPDADARQYFYDYVKAEGETEFGAATESFTEWSELENFQSFLSANLKAGTQFASFRVNHRGTMSESFSNSTRESDLSGTLNQKVAQGRSAAFSIAGGNITSVVGEFLNAAQSTMAGILDSVKLGGLATLAGTAYVDIPRLWDQSTANLPRAEYTIPLYSPYGNKMSRYINLMIPISMILAAGLPLSAGRAAYTSPFLCQIYHKGHVQCQLGMIDSITINRGTGNIGWNTENEMLGAEITFSVVDLSSILHVPIKGTFGTSQSLAGTAVRGALAAGGSALAGDAGAATALGLTGSAAWDEQSTFSDYMAVLGSLSRDDTYYARRRLALNVTKQLRAFNTWRSPSNFASYMSDDFLSRTVMQFAQSTGRF